MIRRVPDNHHELRDFCQVIQTELKLKLPYKGESAAVVGHRFMHQFLVTKRLAVPRVKKEELLQRQDNRCAKCHDPFRGKNWEAHHDPPVSQGGTNESWFCCAALATPQRQKNSSSRATTQSRCLSPSCPRTSCSCSWKPHAHGKSVGATQRPEKPRCVKIRLRLSPAWTWSAVGGTRF